MLRIESYGKNDYKIFINSSYTKDLDYLNKDEVIGFIKLFILKLKNKLSLRGFYKIRVYPKNKIGVFLDITKLDDIDLSNNLDLRVMIMYDEEYYFETDDYDVIKECNDIRYMDGLFYCVVDDSFDRILEKVEFGRFIYGKEVINLLNNSKVL